ncbi:MAG: hypothetical protein EBU93_04825, partial [Chlamydiae bacterium]|nr:hypothetical protein [Chlamydiota bacterium]
DIINNVVKEMMVIKTMASANQVAIPGLAAFMQNQRPLNEVFSQMQGSENKEISLNEPNKEVQQIYLDEDDDDVSESESDDSTYVGESHSEDESDDEKVIVSDDEEEEEDDKKPVNLPEIESIELSNEEEIKVVNIETEVADMPVVINKVEKLEEIEVEESQGSAQTIEEYKQLGTSALKALVISKGLATDVAKLKKPQLLSLLENEN